MKQSTLAFARITADDAATQRAHIAEEHAREHPAASSLPAPVKRGPGRPKRPLELQPPGPGDAEDTAQPAKRGYTNWFSSPYIRDILQAYEKHGRSAKRAVAALSLR
jgi:hypothetical protein